MPDLSGFAAMAARAGVVPLVPRQGNELGNTLDVTKGKRNQSLGCSVPPVPHVPPEIDRGDADEAMRVAFEERAAILEYDEELPRREAERLAGLEIFGAVRSGP